MTAPRLAHGSLLVVDDSPGLRRTLEHLLSPHYELHLAASAEEALSALTPDTALVLTDVQMPGMDGLTLARRIRARRPELPVVCMSGVVEDSLRREAKAAGVLDVVRKPLSAEKLLPALEEWLGGGRATWAPPVRPAARPTPAPMTASAQRWAGAGATAPAAAADQVRDPDEELQTLIRQLGALPGVQTAALFRGARVVAELPNLPPHLGPLSIQALEAAQRLVAAMRSDELRTLQLELGERVGLIWPLPGVTLLVLVQGAPAASSVKAWLRLRAQTLPAPPRREEGQG